MTEATVDRAMEALRNGEHEEAITTLKEAMSSDPGPRPLTKIGELLGNLGNVEEAELCFRRALEKDPGLVGARYNLALARLALGSPREACELLETVVAARPDLAPAWLQLGGARNALGDYQAAIDAFTRHLGIAPDSPAGLTWLGASLQFLGDFDGAEARYRAAIEAAPDFADAHANLGKLLLAQGDGAGAEDHFRRALAARPDHVQAVSGLAARLDDEGRYEEALELISLHSSRAPAVLGPIHARVLRHLGRSSEALTVLNAAESQPGLPADARVQLGFSRAALADEAGEYAEAWRCAERANDLRLSLMPDGAAEASLEAMERAVEDLRRVFRGEAMAGLARSGCMTEKPVFLVGMPRSGKSLAEQILCSHAAVRGAGELRSLGAVTTALAERLGGWPEGATRATPAALDEMARQYLGVLGETAGEEAARVTDTMPFNFVHLGLIEMLFPRARVIHCVRHPLDLLLRCYFKNFAGRSLGFAFSPEHIARYFLSYHALMNHWADVSGLARYELRYESLVSGPEAETRRLLEFLDLPWDPDCLRFHEAGVARSAGPTPIRRPMDPREIGGWRHYESFLLPTAVRLPIEEYERGGF